MDKMKCKRGDRSGRRGPPLYSKRDTPMLKASNMLQLLKKVKASFCTCKAHVVKKNLLFMNLSSLATSISSGRSTVCYTKHVSALFVQVRRMRVCETESVCAAGRVQNLLHVQ